MEHEKVPLSRTESQHEIEIPIVSEIIDLLPVPQKLPCSSICGFSKKESSNLDSKQRSQSATKLRVLIIVYMLFMVVEIVGGVKSNSLAVLTDAAHMLTDVSGFAIALFAVIASGWEATSYQSFGYHRLEVLSALLSVLLIWVVAAILIYEAVNRMLHKHAMVNGVLMFAVAAFGFSVNFIMAMWLGHNHTHHHHHQACGDWDHDHDHGHNHNHDHGKEEACATIEDDETSLVSIPPVKTKILNINLQGAYLHVMADMIQSVGVMIAAAIIWAKPDYLVVDLICTLIFSVFAVSTTIPMLRNTYGILMQRTPSEIDIDKLEKGLKCIKGVQDVHDLHVWALTVGKMVLSCHVTADSTVGSSQIIDEISDLCEKTYRIHDVTVQIEQ
ncbi:metal tolerance protein B [Rosa chinensis]|nr:metal tolerance protein B [Rosa chinensis]